MAKPKRHAEETLTLTLKGDRITADAFAEAITSFLALVREVTAEMTGSSKDVEWLVSVKGGSAQVTYIAERRKPTAPVPEITDTVYHGMKQLNQRPQTSRRVKRPRYFSDSAVKRVREISQLTQRHQVEGIRIRRSRQHSGITDAAAQNAVRILEARPTEVGSIEGRLEMMSVRGRLSFAVWDDLHDSEVRCYIPAGNEELYDRAYRAFRKRVSVFGVLRLTEAGEPVSIQVRDIEVFPDPSELPSADEVYGILTKGSE